MCWIQNNDALSSLYKCITKLSNDVSKQGGNKVCTATLFPVIYEIETGCH